jgi:hypothetical protein
MLPEYVIRVIDLESTGLEPPEAEIIEIGWQDVHRLNGSWRIDDKGVGSRLYGCEPPRPTIWRSITSSRAISKACRYSTGRARWR